MIHDHSDDDRIAFAVAVNNNNANNYYSSHF
jgi:hypothetical protein